MKDTMQDHKNLIAKKKVLIVISFLEHITHDMVRPMSERIRDEYHKDPFLILISCLLSLRARDTATYPVSVALFKKAKTPQELLKIPLSDLERIIYPIGFYKNKARTLHSVSKDIVERFGGKVPDNKDDLVSIKGVGLKTANLVLGVAFGIPAICVDVHVHRICNKLGLVSTKNPDATEHALQEIVPKKYWIEFNKLLVMWGQNKCPDYDILLKKLRGIR